jgi:hypothetical protein
MRVTIIAVPCNGARVTTPLNRPPTLDLLTAAVGGANVEIVLGFAPRSATRNASSGISRSTASGCAWKLMS